MGKVNLTREEYNTLMVILKKFQRADITKLDEKKVLRSMEDKHDIDEGISDYPYMTELAAKMKKQKCEVCDD
jgi:hypothetical protein|tara:strand:+ start:115 stop:330 length:216 start_codon:yes stop_codon:yes gene_type:complete